MSFHITLPLPDPDATLRLADAMARQLRAGDTVLLAGPIGAGKSHFARQVIRQRLASPDEDVPSPSFTLVQTYPGEPEIWHADLYRLSGGDDLAELGLPEAFAHAIVLLEWPDRLGQQGPDDPIRLQLGLDGEGRRAEVSFQGRPALAQALGDLSQALFLAQAGWQGADLRLLAGDASGRRFFRLARPAGTAVLLHNPPGLADRIEDHLRIGRHLQGLGLAVPRVLAEAPARGFLLLEDFGDDLMSRHLAGDAAAEADLYASAVDLILAMQAAPAPQGLPNLSAAEWAEQALLCLSEYRLGATGQTADPAPMARALEAAIRAHGQGPLVLIHRDFFAGNLMVLNRPGLQRLGILDFQLAQMGAGVYDLVSLLQDARRDLAPGVEAAMLARYARAARPGPGFAAAYAVWGAQRALRILGVFARLCRLGGKPDYLVHLPRVMGDLRRNLAHPALAELRGLCQDLLPDPSPEILSRLRSRCAASA